VGEPVAVLDENLEERTERLLARVDALGAALAAGGVSDGAASQLLASASAAVLQALTLEELVAASSAAWIAAPAPVPIAPAAAPAETDVRLAA